MKRKRQKKLNSVPMPQRRQNDRKERVIMKLNFMNPEGLEERIGYKFNNISILEDALTHSSYSNELSQKGVECNCNERLEFLGDSVLSIIVSEYLFEKYTAEAEGKLTNRRRELVCEKALAHYANKLSLGDYLRLGRGEDKNGGRANKSILADAFEALLAAMYLDGGIESVKPYILSFITEAVKREANFKDNKSLLQEEIQKEKGNSLSYEEIGEYGPDHDKTFKFVVKLNGAVVGTGEGRSKKEAEQAAAGDALLKIQK